MYASNYMASWKWQNYRDNKEISVPGVRWKGRIYRQVTEFLGQQNYSLVSCNTVTIDKCPNPSNVQHQECNHNCIKKVIFIFVLISLFSVKISKLFYLVAKRVIRLAIWRHWDNNQLKNEIHGQSVAYVR